MFLKYIILINIISGLFFIIDKINSIHKKYRISEFVLHILELFGGIFSIICLMFLIRHKVSKFRFYIYSYFILFLWIIILIYYNL